jgi:hypothetical protein
LSRRNSIIPFITREVLAKVWVSSSTLVSLSVLLCKSQVVSKKRGGGVQASKKGGGGGCVCASKRKGREERCEYLFRLSV